jgi:hypothetical protein
MIGEQAHKGMFFIKGEVKAQSQGASPESNLSTCAVRQLSCFVNGLLTIIVARLFMDHSVTLGCLLPNSLNHFSYLTFYNSS